MTNKFGDYPYKKPYWKPSKSAEISKAMDRKESSIKSFQDNKESSIAVTSSINNAVEWCVRHPNWKKLPNDAERWKWIDGIAREFLVYFAENKEGMETLYWQLKDRKREMAIKVETEQDIEIGSDEFEPASPVEE